MPVERFVETRILAPLGLEDTHTGYAPDAPWAARMNPAYRRNDGGEWFKYWTPDVSEVFPYFRASGGLLSTTFDYARWLAAWMDGRRFSGSEGKGGGRLLTEGMIERALTRRGGGYGLHWEVRQMDPLVFGHGGLGELAVFDGCASLYVTLLRPRRDRANYCSTPSGGEFRHVTGNANTRPLRTQAPNRPLESQRALGFAPLSRHRSG